MFSPNDVAVIFVLLFRASLALLLMSFMLLRTIIPIGMALGREVLLFGVAGVREVALTLRRHPKSITMWGMVAVWAVAPVLLVLTDSLIFLPVFLGSCVALPRVARSVRSHYLA